MAPENKRTQDKKVKSSVQPYQIETRNRKNTSVETVNLRDKARTSQEVTKEEVSSKVKNREEEILPTSSTKIETNFNNERIEKMLEWFEKFHKTNDSETTNSFSDYESKLVPSNKRKVIESDEEDDGLEYKGKRAKFSKNDSLNHLLKNLKSFKGKGDNYLGWFENTTRFLRDLEISDNIKIN